MVDLSPFKKSSTKSKYPFMSFKRMELLDKSISPYLRIMHKDSICSCMKAIMSERFSIDVINGRFAGVGGEFFDESKDNFSEKAILKSLCRKEKWPIRSSSGRAFYSFAI